MNLFLICCIHSKWIFTFVYIWTVFLYDYQVTLVTFIISFIKQYHSQIHSNQDLNEAKYNFGPIKGIFIVLSKVFDWVLFCENSQWLKAVYYFPKSAVTEVCRIPTTPMRIKLKINDFFISCFQDIVSTRLLFRFEPHTTRKTDTERNQFYHFILLRSLLI